MSVQALKDRLEDKYPEPSSCDSHQPQFYETTLQQVNIGFGFRLVQCQLRKKKVSRCSNMNAGSGRDGKVQGLI
jgi:hypothetical protein